LPLSLFDDEDDDDNDDDRTPRDHQD